MKYIKAILASLTLIALIFLIANLIAGFYIKGSYITPFSIFKMLGGQSLFYLIFYLGVYLFPILIGFFYATEWENKRKMKYMWGIVCIDILYKIILFLTIFRSSGYNLGVYSRAIWVAPELIGLIIGIICLSFLRNTSQKIQDIVLSISFLALSLLTYLII